MCRAWRQDALDEIQDAHFTLHAKTDYYYYALDTATGTHKFFKTAGEFNAFVATQNYDQ